MIHDMVRLLSAVLFMAAGTAAGAQQRNLLTSGYDSAAVNRALAGPGDFAPVPRASDTYWRDSVPGPMRRSYIEWGGRCAGQPWESLPATLFAQFRTTGNRTAYEAACFAKRQRLAALVMAEIMEGGGRFMPDIIDGLQSTMEETWWGLPAHYGRELPDAADQNVDIFNAETAALLAWTSYMLAERLDAFSPLMRKRIDSEIDRRLLRPAMRKNWWWKKAGMNWNPWICSNWLTCVLLCEHDRQHQTEAVWQIMQAMDAFIDAYPADGGCDEGTDYWDRAAASLYECLDMLRLSTGGLIDMSRNGKIAAMGSYIYKMYIGGGYCVNFADAHHNRMQLQVNVAYPFGLYLGDRTMCGLAAYSARQAHLADSAAALYMRSGNWAALGRELVMLRHAGSLLRETPCEPQAADTWLPDLQIMTARRGSMFVAMKGGTNGESHNHNDVGSFIVYADNRPLLIDPGVGEYTAQTFGSGRYDIWTMQSDYHNLPQINGAGQSDGRDYAARNAVYSRGRLSADIAGAYPDTAAAVRRWTRTVRAAARAVEIVEDYELREYRGPSRLMFVTTARPDTAVEGVVAFGNGGTAGGVHRMVYDPSQLSVAVEDISEKLDTLLRGQWGESMYRIVMTVKSHGLKGRIKYKVY